MEARKQQLIEHFITKCSMAIEEARNKADMNCNLQDELKKRDVRFKFLKKDGTIRVAYGTLHKDVIPPTLGTGRPLGFGLQLFFDLECMSYRSFKKENLISFE
jgi:hypothetical protein